MIDGIDFMTILLSVFTLAIFVAGIIWWWGGFKNKDTLTQPTQMSRGRTNILYRGHNTVVEGSDDLGGLHRRLHLRTSTGQLIRQDGVPEDFPPVDPWQPILGPGAPVHEYRPSARTIRAELEQRDQETTSRVAVKEAREKTEDARSDLKLATAETKYEVRDQVEIAVQVAKAAAGANRPKQKGG